MLWESFCSVSKRKKGSGALASLPQFFFGGGPLLRADFTDDPGCDNLGVVAELHLKADF